MAAIEQQKANSGFLDGMTSSKKLGLTATFVTSCFAILPTLATQVLQIAMIAAATLAVVGYLISQALVEKAWGAIVEDKETETWSVPQESVTTTMAAK